MKSAYDRSHVQSVTAWALLHDGKHAGNVVANWSDNPNGSVVTCTVNVFTGPLAFLPSCTGQAGGGYCKFSAAFDSAIRRTIKTPGKGDAWKYHPEPDSIEKAKALSASMPDLSGRGASTVRNWLESLGYVVASVIGPS